MIKDIYCLLNGEKKTNKHKKKQQQKQQQKQDNLILE